MNAWKPTKGRVQWPGRVSAMELQPAEQAELESELEMRTESRPGAELPSAPSELQKGKRSTNKQCIKSQRSYIDKDKDRMLAMCGAVLGSLPGTEGVVKVAVTGVTTALATAA